MTDDLQFVYASDKDVFDLLMSNKQRFSDSSLRSMALKRGFIYSKSTASRRLVSEISLMPHDYFSISEMIKARETSRKQEKMTCITIPVALSRNEMKAIVEEYSKSAGDDEKLTFQPRRAHDLYVNLAYDEVDYSKTRLIQRQRKDAGIEFITNETSTTIRMPSTEKAKDVVERLRVNAEKLRTEKLQVNKVELYGLNADQKTNFFMYLMRNMPGYRYETAVNLKVSSSSPSSTSSDIDLDLDEEEIIEENITGIVNSVILSGTNLDQSEEYQSLRRKGYFISSSTWRASQIEKPHDLLQFEISFDNGREGVGFKYSARIAKRLKEGTLTEKFQALEVNRQPAIYRLIEQTAADVLEKLKSGA